jgi:hypothetical protein
MGGVEVPRPLTHDLILSFVSHLRAEVTRIEIYDIREGTFYARILLRTEGGDIAVDARPSDAIGVAVRALCPVFIAESVVEEAGISVNLVAGLRLGEADSSSASPSSVPDAIVPVSSEGEIGKLRAELETAVAEEDYERAAAIRDKLRELES